MGRRILIALALLGLWAALRAAPPAGLSGFLPAAVQALSALTHRLWTACAALGEQIGGGEDAVACLGSFARQVFLPA